MTHLRIAAETSAELTKLKAEFKARGFYVKPTGRIIRQLALHLAITAGGFALVLLTESLWFTALGILIVCSGSMGLATNTHTSCHGASSDKRWVNRALTYFGYPFFLGLSATYWMQKHNVMHHGSPNVVGMDDDIRLKPWFAFYQTEVNNSGPLARAYFRVQWLGMPLAALLLGAQLQVYSFMYLYGVARGKRGWVGAHWLDISFVGLHWLVWLALPMAFLPVSHVLLFNAAWLAIIGCYLFAVFAPAHFPAEAAVLELEGRGKDNFLLQTSTTVNFRTGFYGDLICSGLQYQIEHHLFPGISHVHYPAMRPLVQEFCERNGYPYRTMGWGEALWKTLLNFVRPKEVTHQLERNAA